MNRTKSTNFQSVENSSGTMWTDDGESSDEISHWLHNTTCIWVVLLFGHAAREICFTSANYKHYPDLGSDTLSVWNFLRSFLRRHFAGKPVVASRNVGWFPVGYTLLWKPNKIQPFNQWITCWLLWRLNQDQALLVGYQSFACCYGNLIKSWPYRWVLYELCVNQRDWTNI